MRRHSLVRKLFVITSLIIICLLALVFVFESLFFERFYRSVKQHDQETAVLELKEQVESLHADEQAVGYMIGSAMNKYDASIALLNEEYRVKPLDVYFIDLKSGENRIKIIIDEEGLQYGDLPKQLSLGKSLVVDGIYMDENDTVMDPIEFYPKTVEPAVGLVRIQGTVTDLLLPEQRSYNPMYQDLLIQAMINDWMSEEHSVENSSQYMTTVWRDSWSGVEYIATLGKLDLDGSSSFIVMMTSLQPVDEAITMLQKYVLVLCPFVFVIVILLAVLYSRYIARPLVKINAFAAKLAQLQFSAALPIQSRDEYGQLSQHLVTLSHNLERALEEVKQRNEQLHVEISKKIHLEELRKELVANIAHELKTPLAVVKGYAEGLQDGIANHKREAYIAHIVHETDVMNELIMDLLELSRYEGNAIALTLTHFNIVELIQNEVKALSIHLANKSLHVDINTRFLNQPYVIGDQKRIKQVVVNLLSNAARHAKTGSTLSIEIKEIEDKKINVTIYNEGQPIPQEHLERIWEKFYRVEQARDRRSGGTGLGLTIVKHILQLHKSQYGAVNQQHGVAFYFTLNEGCAKENEHEE